jgi:peptide/nickel transport system permease protein
MIAYLIRRILYAIPILIGVNLLTFALFFVVNTPDDMARMQLGIKRVTPEAIDRWKQQRGYDKPLFVNTSVDSAGTFTDTIFWQKSASMFAFDFGYSDDGRSISREIATRMGPSLAIALPTFLIGLVVYVSFALLMTLFRATALDMAGVALCVLLMSISGLFYIIGGQFLVSKLWHLVPISGYAGGADAFKFVLLPILIGIAGGVGSSSRWYRTIFLDEIGKDSAPWAWQ